MCTCDDSSGGYPLVGSRYKQTRFQEPFQGRRCDKNAELQPRRFPFAYFASSAENATSRHDHARPDSHASHRASHRTFFGSPAPHCARAHGHAEHVLRLPAQAHPSHEMPKTRPQEVHTCTPAHPVPLGRRRSRQPLDPTPRSRRSRRRWPRRGQPRLPSGMAVTKTT